MIDKYIGYAEEAFYKIYFEDVGLRNVRLHFRQIDFIATLGSKKYYIQSAYAISDKEKYEQETSLAI